MVEVDRVFRSLAEWTEWASQNPSVYVAAEADSIGERICAAGFVEPFTGQVVAPGELAQVGTN